MGKIDKLKESLTSLRTGLSILSAFLIALGGAVGTLYNSNNVGILFWVSVGLMALTLVVGYVIIHKIRQKINEIEDL